MSPLIAAHAASFMGSGIGKSGKPCARFTAWCMLAMRVISRMTDSVNVAVRLAASTRLSSNFGQGAADQLRRAHVVGIVIDRVAHRALRIPRRVAERHERPDRVLGGRAVR